MEIWYVYNNKFAKIDDGSPLLVINMHINEIKFIESKSLTDFVVNSTIFYRKTCRKI